MEISQDIQTWNNLRRKCYEVLRELNKHTQIVYKFTETSGVASDHIRKDLVVKARKNKMVKNSDNIDLWLSKMRGIQLNHAAKIIATAEEGIENIVKLSIVDKDAFIAGVFNRLYWAFNQLTIIRQHIRLDK